MLTMKRLLTSLTVVCVVVLVLLPISYIYLLTETVKEVEIKGVDGERRHVTSEVSHGAPLLVLVLSSMARSGSSLTSTILSSINNSVTFFEPLWLVEKRKTWINDGAQVAQFLREIFTCEFSDHFENWLKDKSLFVEYFSPETKACLKKENAKEKKLCLKGLNLRKLCLESPVRVVKVIRARLATTEALLRDSRLNLKVIQLVRDPRASLYSISHFGSDWDKSPYRRCVGVQEDLLNFPRLSDQFPAKVLQLRFEQLCMDPLTVVGDLFRFLLGDAEMAPKALNIMKNKIVLGKDDVSSRAKVDAWRYKIPGKLLQDVESEPTCQRSIITLGHTFFITETNARNSSISLFSSSYAGVGGATL